MKRILAVLMALAVLAAVPVPVFAEGAETNEGIQTLIGADNHWALLTVLFAATAMAIWLEQKYRWASRISGAIITLAIALILVNLRVIPASAPVFDDIVWGYAVPLAIPLLLLQTNIRKIWKETGRFLLIFLIGAAGTVAGTILATVLLSGAVDGLPGAAAMMTGSYIGGGVNFTAIADAFHVSGSLISSTTVADNLNMALYFLALLGIAGNAFFRKHYTHPHIDAVASRGKGDTETLAKQYWTGKNASLKDIAIDMAYAAAIVFLSRLIREPLLPDRIPKDNWFSPDAEHLLRQPVCMDHQPVGDLGHLLPPQAGGGYARRAGDRHLADLPVLLRDRRACLHRCADPECPDPAAVLHDYRAGEHAVLLPGRKTVQIQPGGDRTGVQRQHRRADHGGRHGNLPGLGEADRSLHAGGHLWLCDRHLAGHPGRVDPRRVSTERRNKMFSDDARGFVSIGEAIPDVILEIRYYSTFNFIGDRVDGYEQPVALLTREAAARLKEAGGELAGRGYRMRIYDAYRPQKAVDHFMRWAKDVSDIRMKAYFYPDLNKNELIPGHYIAEHSGHSRGSTVDLTLFDMRTGAPTACCSGML